MVKYHGKSGRSSKGLRLYSPGIIPGPSAAVVIVIIIEPELLFPDGSDSRRFSGGVLPRRSTAVGGLQAFSWRGVAIPAGSASSARPIWPPPARHIISAKSEAKHRKRSVFMSATIIPHTPLDNHNPHLITFLG